VNRLVPLVLRSWSLPLVVLALVAPSAAAFYLVGPQLGLAVGALTAGAVIVLAARARYDEEIEVAGSPDDRYRLLVLAPVPLEEPALAERIAAIAAEGEAALSRRGGPAELRVVVPARSSRLDRWASDLEPARASARRALAVSLGALAVAGLDASGRVGDDDPVQAVEDELRGFAAREVIVVEGPGVDAEAVNDLRRRLDRPVRRVGSPGSASPG
jgi:hypothetical protein